MGFGLGMNIVYSLVLWFWTKSVEGLLESQFPSSSTVRLIVESSSYKDLLYALNQPLNSVVIEEKMHFFKTYSVKIYGKVRLILVK